MTKFLRRAPTILLTTMALINSAPKSVDAQVSVAATCASAPSTSCTTWRFAVTNSSARPLYLASLQLDLQGDWLFSSAAAEGADDFSAFGAAYGSPVDGTLLSGGSSIFIDFVAPIGWFDLATPGSAGFLLIDAVGSDPFAFNWGAVDLDRVDYSGRFTAPVPSTVPEPVSMTLLGSGLAGVALARCRRRSGAQRTT